jgi:transposase InsO family protein
MTDNGSCYRSRAFATACKRLRIKHIRTRPYTPQTNGKAERFIQTALRECTYATAFETSEQRRAELAPWLHRYNWHRPHASLDKKTPISRLGSTGNYLLSFTSRAAWSCPCNAAAERPTGASRSRRFPSGGGS